MLKAVKGRIIVKDIDASDREVKTPSGIIIPDTVKNIETKIGKVVSISTEDLPNILEDDLIIYSRFGGEAIQIDGKNYKVIKVEDILCRII